EPVGEPDATFRGLGLEIRCRVADLQRHLLPSSYLENVCGEPSHRRVWRKTVCAAEPRCTPTSSALFTQSRPYLRIWTLPASSPGNEHRAPATSGLTPDPPSARPRRDGART